MKQRGPLHLGEICEQKLPGLRERSLQGLERQLLRLLVLGDDAAAQIVAVGGRVEIQLKGMGLHGAEDTDVKQRMKRR